MKCFVVQEIVYEGDKYEPGSIIELDREHVILLSGFVTPVEQEIEGGDDMGNGVKCKVIKKIYEAGRLYIENDVMTVSAERARQLSGYVEPLKKSVKKPPMNKMVQSAPESKG